MTVSKTFVASCAPPTASYNVGEGSFLVGFWGEGIKYTKDDKLWYEHPKQMDWAKGSYAELDDFTANENEKTIDFRTTPIFINQFHLLIDNTATVGNRNFVLYTYDSTESGTTYVYNNGYHTANETTFVHFGGGSYNDTDLAGSFVNDIQLPKFWNDNTPYWNKLKVRDSSDIDSNDDYYIILRGVYAVPKYHWIELKNCEKLQFNVIPDSRGDVIGETDLDFTPVSLRVIKI